MPGVLFLSFTVAQSPLVFRTLYGLPGVIWSVVSSTVRSQFFVVPEFLYCPRSSILCPEFHTLPEFLYHAQNSMVYPDF